MNTGCECDTKVELSGVTLFLHSILSPFVENASSELIRSSSLVLFSLV
jgi:hypothetical protein